MSWFGVAANCTATGGMMLKGWDAVLNHIPDYRNLMTSFNLLQQNSRSRGQRSSGRFPVTFRWRCLSCEASLPGEIIAAL